MPKKGGLPMRKFKLNKLRSAELKSDFQAGLQSKLEYNWDQLNTAIL
jgi:hypothetical protein